MVQRLRRLGHRKFHIHLDGVALAGPDPRPVFIENIPLLAVAPHDLLQNILVNKILLTDACQQRIYIRPAVGIQLDSDDLRLVPKDQTYIFTDPCEIRRRLSHSVSSRSLVRLTPPG